jgi:hypothetical protein
MAVSGFAPAIRGALIALLLSVGAVSGRAQDVSGVIALPDVPFVIPTYSKALFPDDPAGPDVLTQHGNNNRDGVTRAPGVNQNSVKEFRRLGELNVNGVAAAQPLFAHDVSINGRRQPALIVATSMNYVYAFPPTENARELWRVPLGAPDLIDPNRAAPRCRRLANPSVQQDQDYDLTAHVGIDGTPVIDLANNQVLVGFRSKDRFWRLAAIDLDSQAVRTVVVPRNSDWQDLHRNRAGLLLADGVVYMPFAAMCEGADSPRYHGSIFAFDARTLAFVGAYAVTDADTDGGGIWQGGGGVAADDHGNLYFSTGNRRYFTPEHDDKTFDSANLTSSVLRVKTTKVHSGEAPGYSVEMKTGDYFTPYRKIWLDRNDMDVASGGVVLIPRTRYLAAAGKEGVLYVLDRADFGHFDSRGYADSDSPASWSTASVVSRLGKSRDEIVARHLMHDDKARDFMHQKFPAGVNQYDLEACPAPPNPCFIPANQATLQTFLPWPHVHGTPAFARFGEKQFLYVWAEKDRLKRFRWLGDRFDPEPSFAAALAPPLPLADDNRYPISVCVDPSDTTKGCLNVHGNGMPGGMLTINVDGGDGVLFASLTRCAEDPDPKFHPFPCTNQQFGSLRAFDPFTMEEIWNDCGPVPGVHDCHLVWPPGADDYWFQRFVSPTVANGRVFQPTASGKIIVYGRGG